MGLPYDIKVVLPFDIATAQDMNERHANDVALAAGTGINDGAITADKLDLTSFQAPYQFTGSTYTGGPGTVVTSASYSFKANMSYLVQFTTQQVSLTATGTVYQLDLKVGATVVGTIRAEGQSQSPAPIVGLFTPSSDTSSTVVVAATRSIGTANMLSEVPRIIIIPLLYLAP